MHWVGAVDVCKYYRLGGGRLGDLVAWICFVRVYLAYIFFFVIALHAIIASCGLLFLNRMPYFKSENCLDCSQGGW